MIEGQLEGWRGGRGKEREGNVNDDDEDEGNEDATVYDVDRINILNPRLPEHSFPLTLGKLRLSGVHGA